jgi:hypothetical protein
MNARIKQLWLDALRSGNYSQWQGRLRNGDSFCCLGVLCDLHRKETGAGRWTSVADERSYELPDNSSIAEFYLPTEVAIWAGIADAEDNPDDCARENSNETGSVQILVAADPSAGVLESPSHPKGYAYLSNVNDAGHPFSVIADLIEASIFADSAAEVQ